MNVMDQGLELFTRQAPVSILIFVQSVTHFKIVKFTISFRHTLQNSKIHDLFSLFVQSVTHFKIEEIVNFFFTISFRQPSWLLAVRLFESCDRNMIICLAMVRSSTAQRNGRTGKLQLHRLQVAYERMYTNLIQPFEGLSQSHIPLRVE